MMYSYNDASSDRINAVQMTFNSIQTNISSLHEYDDYYHPFNVKQLHVIGSTYVSRLHVN